ncbi:heavy-metal-associated domain-containing protein [Hoyosella subflava]|uniref:Conserved domain protein n=1 Tax=Hoyosella subflava (strain DSM 45089 / JCM 17490 / NBRC 109087 / DQS3-9A1) TaxID=443218 RepID=F6EP22_HOYSD|nr:cation transporter [Hoyosella subflava]AEF40488.1 Conserved domain protein [Hoyosella subflava DQS3-9A1]
MPVTTTITVKGMTCGHCESAVRSEIADVDGVTSVDVDLPSGAVTITSDHELDEAAVRAAVDEAGYTVA